ncbi:MAG: Asp-tRNA(Asn)/Glu-tRNA(Gln) amidotransferase subunit GatC [Clostridiales bacterium]|nr:Asp-tRNA(Asn)/Glu-tRNA(Gln) amidotransferase subunit GatC [Clostridiales bacterium]
MISDSRLESLAESAKIELIGKDKVSFKKDLDKLIKSFDILKDVETTDIKPMINVHDYRNVFRDDKVENNDYNKNQEVALRNAPNKKEGFILVPKIME